MQRIMLNSKIHRATVTDANLNYEGSITIDEGLMKSADLVPFEKVAIYNVSNGERFSTYVIEGKKGSGVICLNGAAARKVSKGRSHHHCELCHGRRHRVEEVDPEVRPRGRKEQNKKIASG